MQEAQWQAAKANLVPCRNCQRRFAPDRLGVHERVCRGTKKPPPRDARDEEEISVKGKYRTNVENFDENSSPNGAPRSRNGQNMKQRRVPKFVFCYICGRQFTDASLPIHEPQCLLKWEIQNNKLPPSMRRPRPRKPECLAGTAASRMSRFVFNLLSVRHWKTSIFSARQHICYSTLYAHPSVRPSVFLSHGWISRKRLKLGSCNFHN